MDLAFKDAFMSNIRQSAKWLASNAGALIVPLLAIGAMIIVLFIWSPGRETEQSSAEIWTCSMHPQVQLNRPGRCPICGMALIPLSQFKSEQVRIEQQAGL